MISRQWWRFDSIGACCNLSVRTDLDRTTKTKSRSDGPAKGLNSKLGRPMTMESFPSRAPQPHAFFDDIF